MSEYEGNRQSSADKIGTEPEVVDESESPEESLLLTLPEEFDSDWAEMFNAAFSSGGAWTVIESDFCLLQTDGFGDFRPGRTQFSPFDVRKELGGDDRNPIAGRILGVKLITRQYYDEEGVVLDPYLVLSDVDFPCTKQSVTNYAEQQVMVPLAGVESLLLTTD